MAMKLSEKRALARKIHAGHFDSPLQRIVDAVQNGPVTINGVTWRKPDPKDRSFKWRERKAIPCTSHGQDAEKSGSSGIRTLKRKGSRA